MHKKHKQENIHELEMWDFYSLKEVYTEKHACDEDILLKCNNYHFAWHFKISFGNSKRFVK